MEAAGNSLKAPKIYFYCCQELGNLQEDIIAIAEGLIELGIPYYSCCDYWLRSAEPGNFLFRHNPEVRHQDCDIVIVAYTWPRWVRMGDFKIRERPLPSGLFERGRKWLTVFIDNNDGYKTIAWEPEFRQFDLILRTKFNKRAYHPTNMRPWAYGLTQRVIDATDDSGQAFSTRNKALLVNFGASHPFSYGARQLAARKLEPVITATLAIDRTKDDLSVEPTDPYEALMWKQTGGRFCRNYYERLKNTQAVACFCGDVIPPAPWKPEAYLVGGHKASLRRMAFEVLGLFDRRAPRAVGSDSFRFWEALSAGCAAINLDLEYYGVEFPLMPVNGVHYLGVNFGKTKEFIELLCDAPNILQNVADAGRRWARSHYSPLAAAQRLLAICAAK